MLVNYTQSSTLAQRGIVMAEKFRPLFFLPGAFFWNLTYTPQKIILRQTSIANSNVNSIATITVSPTRPVIQISPRPLNRL